MFVVENKNDNAMAQILIVILILLWPCYATATNVLKTDEIIDETRLIASADLLENVDSPSIFDDLKKYAQEKLSVQNIEKYNNLIRVHFSDVLQGSQNFKIHEIIGHKYGPYHSFVVGYKERDSCFGWRGLEEVIVVFKNDEVAYSDLKEPIICVRRSIPVMEGLQLLRVSL